MWPRRSINLSLARGEFLSIGINWRNRTKRCSLLPPSFPPPTQLGRDLHCSLVAPLYLAPLLWIHLLHLSILIFPNRDTSRRGGRRRRMELILTWSNSPGLCHIRFSSSPRLDLCFYISVGDFVRFVRGVSHTWLRSKLTDDRASVAEATSWPRCAAAHPEPSYFSPSPLFHPPLLLSRRPPNSSQLILLSVGLFSSPPFIIQSVSLLLPSLQHPKTRTKL